MNPKPCPFCGHTFVTVVEGTTFRWCKASCSYCEGSGPEVRGRLDTKDVAEASEARAAAIGAWNQRAEDKELAQRREHMRRGIEVGRATGGEA